MAEPLLGPADPPPFEIVNPDGAARVVLLADHGGRAIPQVLGTLGLGPAELARHIAWDIGIGDVTRRLARRLDAPAVLAGYSRLVIDPNRPPGAPGSIPATSAGIRVPGNEGLTPPEIEERRRALFDPYHAAIAAGLDRREKAGASSALLAIHSFTPDYPGQVRPWTIAASYNRDRRLAGLLIEWLRREPGLVVGDNQPYSVDDESDYTIPVHGERRGLPHFLDRPGGGLADRPGTRADEIRDQRPDHAPHRFVDQAPARDPGMLAQHRPQVAGDDAHARELLHLQEPRAQAVVDVVVVVGDLVGEVGDLRFERGPAPLEKALADVAASADRSSGDGSWVRVSGTSSSRVASSTSPSRATRVGSVPSCAWIRPER